MEMPKESIQECWKKPQASQVDAAAFAFEHMNERASCSTHKLILPRAPFKHKLIKSTYIFFQFSLHKIGVIDANEAYYRLQDT